MKVYEAVLRVGEGEPRYPSEVRHRTAMATCDAVDLAAYRGGDLATIVAVCDATRDLVEITSSEAIGAAAYDTPHLAIYAGVLPALSRSSR